MIRPVTGGAGIEVPAARAIRVSVIAPAASGGSANSAVVIGPSITVPVPGMVAGVGAWVAGGSDGETT